MSEKSLSTTPDAGIVAAKQAAEYGGMFAMLELRLDDGGVIEVPPHPNLRMFDDEGLAALDQLHFDLESYDRMPDVVIPAQSVKDKAGNELQLPAETVQGALKTNPYRKTDPVTGRVEVLNPPYEVQVARIALGEEDYGRLRAGRVNGRKGSAADVWRLWNTQANAVAERRASDSKSDGGVVDLASVSGADS